MFEKPDIVNSCEAIKNHHVKCGGYLLSFSMRADDDEQHFN